MAQNQQFIALLQADQEVADQADKLTHKKRLKAKRDARKAKERAEKAALSMLVFFLCLGKQKSPKDYPHFFSPLCMTSLPFVISQITA